MTKNIERDFADCASNRQKNCTERDYIELHIPREIYVRELREKVTRESNDRSIISHARWENSAPLLPTVSRLMIPVVLHKSQIHEMNVEQIANNIAIGEICDAELICLFFFSL